MVCKRYQRAIADVAAGAPTAADLEFHLAACGACRAELGALQRGLALADAGLRHLLATEATPALRARIRRVAGEAAGRTRSGGFETWGALPATGAALMACAVVVIVWRQVHLAHRSRPAASALVAHRDDESAAPAHPRTVDAAPPAPPPTAGAPTGSRPAADSTARSPRARHSPIPRTVLAEPEVLIPPGEADALFRFALELQHRQVAPDSLLVADRDAPLPAPKLIEIAPLEIVPLDPSGPF